MVYKGTEDFKSFLREKSLHVMEKKDIKEFSKIAGNAYPMDYPIFPYFFGEENSREKITRVLQLNYNVVYKYGVGLSLEDMTLGNGLFMPPGYKGTGMLSYMTSGAVGLFFKIGKAACDRMIVYENYCMELLNKYRDDNTWYGLNLVVAAEHQGQGVAASGMRSVFEYFDNNDASIYLETHSLRNSKLYEHFGFETMEVGKIPGTDINHYAMMRKPHHRQ